MKIRAFAEHDCEEIFGLYRDQCATLPYHHKVRLDQFRKELFTTRYIRNPRDHHERAKIALVAEDQGQVCAFVSGGLVLTGDEVVANRTGYIQAIIAA